MRRIAAVGDESRTVRITAANMARGEWVRGVDRCAFVGIRILEEPWRVPERPRELHAASSVVAELTPFSFSLFFSFSLVRSSLAPPRGGRRRQVGEEGEPLRRTVSDRGPVARRCPLKRGRGRDLCGCDHTSVNAPDPIRTPQLSALGLE